MCAYKDVTVTIKKLHFDKKDRMWVFLSDGRELIIPLSMLPTIKKLSIEDRKKHHFPFGHIIFFSVPNIDITIKDLVNLSLTGDYLVNIEVEEQRKKKNLKPKGYI